MTFPDTNNTASANASARGEGGSCPFSRESWQERPQGDTIPCPALLAFYNNGWINPDADGNISTAQLDAALAQAGISEKVRKALVKGADGTDAIPEHFNLFKLRDSQLDHSGSTGIRDPEVSAEKLESALLRFSENGRMYAEHFAAAANQAQRNDPGLKGTAIETLEFTALLEVFGRLDEQQHRYVTSDDVKRLWLEGKFPADWQPRAANDIGVDDVLKAVAVMAIQRVLDGIGRKG
ncbi:MAG: hypothetical protein ACK46L_12965 [Synechococcaceae cyanobacterium]|jgi:hypothetical protein